MFIGLRERSRSSLYNAVFAVQNGVLQRDIPYRKRQLVPLAEAMFSPGSSPSVFEQGGLRIGFLICWENVFCEFSLDYAWRGANLLAFVSDDSWAQGSRTAVLHSRISAFRSLETGIPSAFVAKGGFSTVLMVWAEFWCLHLISTTACWKFRLLRYDLKRPSSSSDTALAN